MDQNDSFRKNQKPLQADVTINNSQASREEGELSSYEDDGNREIGSFSQVTSTNVACSRPIRIGDAADTVEVVQSALTDRSMQTDKAGKSASSNMLLKEVGPEHPPPSSQLKNERNRVPFVISFSDDDDSGSNPEDCGRKPHAKLRELGLDKSRRQLATSRQKPQKFQPSSVTKVNPGKASFSRTFVSSTIRRKGVLPRKNSASFVNSRSLSTSKKVVAQDHGHNTNSILDTSIVQDLRQLIAKKENELKRKSSQQTRVSTLPQCKADRYTGLSDGKARLGGTSLVDIRELEAKGPANKRPKTTKTELSLLSDGKRENTQQLAILASENVLLENSDKQKEDICTKEVPPNVTYSILSPKEREGCIGPVNMKEGTDTLGKDRQNSRYSEVGSVLTSSKKHALTEYGTSKNIPIKANSTGLKLGAEWSIQHPSPAFQNNVHLEDNVTIGSGPHLIESNGKALEPTPSTDRYQFQSHHTPDGKPSISDLSMGNPNFWNSIRMGNGDFGLQVLLDLEVSNDKELDEAQEHRRQCEIEERNALNLYRKAQRALAEANAKCSYLYRKREMYSSQLRSVMMENTNLFSTFGTDDQFEPQLNHINNYPIVGANVTPAGNGENQAKYDGYDQHTFDTDAVTPEVNHSLQRQGVSGDAVVSDQSSEYDDSAKEPKNGDGVYCPSEDSSMAEDENGVTYHVNEHNLADERKEQSSGKSEKEINTRSEGQEHIQVVQDSQDSLLLEASLRSQLFERLRTNAFSKKSLTSHVDPLDDTGIDNCSEKGELIPEKQLPSLEDEEKYSNISGYQQTSFVTLLSTTLRSAFRHLKISDPANSDHVQSLSGSPEMQICDDKGHIENQQNNYTGQITLKDLNVGNTGSYSCSVTIDPFWPLCMYELRGKCNNDECALQHAKNFAREDSLVSSEQGDEDSVMTRPCGSLVLIPPIYLVDVEVLHVNLGSHKSFSNEACGHYWRKCYSSTLVLSSVLPTDLPLDEPFLHGNESRVESPASWNRQLFHFDSKIASMKQTDHSIIDNDQALETALLNLQYEANKQKGRLEALKVLVRAVEADPSSAVLWIVYLQIYYSNQKSIGKDNLFQYAVEYNKSSYELWLLYINSQTQLDDRLEAYNAALHALCCRHVSDTDVSSMHASPYILDIFLQKMNCLCMSGNVSKVLEIVYGLSSSTKRSDIVTFPDVIEFLTVYDKCVLWVSFVYLAIYRKVPGEIVQQFEFPKDPSAIEWPNTQLITEEKQKAISLMESAVNFLEEEINNKSLDNEETLKAAHLFAVNHVKCIAVLEGIGCGRDLLDKYTKLYPSCLELVLMSAWTESDKFEGFEIAISNWLDGIPGIHCLWNQYVECALESEKIDFAKELMTRWFKFSCKVKVQCDESDTFDSVDVENVLKSGSGSGSGSVSLSIGWCSFPNYNDVVFGLLNFSIYKALHGDQTEALSALERALKASAAGNYLHCVREHCLFSSVADSQHHKESHLRTRIKLLNRYLVDAPASNELAPLSRHYVEAIKKPRVQQLVSKLLNPLSDFSLLNSILEVWYGPSLLPQTFEKLSDLVDFAEGVMGLLPSNYKLAISVCRFLIQSSKTAKLPANVSFWASSLLMNALFLAVPVAPESVWLESAEILCHLSDLPTVSESFHKRALLVHPFSIKLWESYLGLVNDTSEATAIREAASAKGLSLAGKF